MDWTTTYQEPDELRRAFAGSPDARYRPLTAWWWSGETVTEERMLWQLDQIHRLGCGGIAITGFALHCPVGGSVADDPPAFGDEWIRLYRLATTRARELGMGAIAWSPSQPGFAVDYRRILRRRPDLRGELVSTRGGSLRIEPYGLDFGNPEAMKELRGGADTINGRLAAATEDLLGDVLVAVFEDEFPAFPRWSPTFLEDFRSLKGYEPPLEAFDQDVGPRTPAIRWDLFDVLVTRAERAYTQPYAEWVRKHNLLAGYDQMARGGRPQLSSLFYGDPFRTMAWANAPGTDQMGDARFYLSIADLTGAPRVWLEGFHSYGWGMSLSDQMRLLFEWGREGANLFLPHGMYYAGRGCWWEWAPPEMGWKQPYARHYPVFAQSVGRLMSALSAGRHVPEVAVLYPLSTMWACTSGHLEWEQQALDTTDTYTALFGHHGGPSYQDLERSATPSLLAEAFYDRMVVDEAHASSFDIPIILPSCLCLRTETVDRLASDAERGRLVVVVRPEPSWSAEHGRDDDAFAASVRRLIDHAVVVDTPAEAVRALPAPRVEGLKSQWRRVGALDLLLVTGSGTARIRAAGNRRPERWDITTGKTAAIGAVRDGEDLVVELEGPATLIALPPGTPEPVVEIAYDELPLPEMWAVDYLEWGENRWGDYRLPPSDGTPPTERRTFAHREGDDPAWRLAPVTPEDLEHPTTDLGFEERMAQARGRPEPAARTLPDGWHEVVSTYGPKAVLDGDRLVEYSERLGVEDLKLTTPIGLKGFVEPWKADLGPDGGGRIVSWAHIPTACDTHLVVEGAGVLTLSLDGHDLIGPVEGGVISVPVHLDAGWHEVAIRVTLRGVAPPVYTTYAGGPRTLVTWSFTQPYEREPKVIIGGRIVHPEYKGGSGARRYRRRVVVPEVARVRTTCASTGAVGMETPDTLEPGEHWLEFLVGESIQGAGFACTVRLEMEQGTVRLVSDERWESCAAGEDWVGALPLGLLDAIAWGGGELLPRPPWRTALLDVGWLEADASGEGHVEDVWSDSPEPGPPSWFCFTAPPGARSMSLPITGEVQAWVDGAAVALTHGTLPLQEHTRVALRVQAPPGHRGAACFREHPILELGPGTLRAGVSWHRQGLDCFSGVILHRCEVRVPRSARAVLDLGDVRGSVGVRVNGREAGVIAWPPWRIEIDLEEGTNTIELEVTNTLGPMVSRGIPTPFGPEDQRPSGLLSRPRLLLQRA